MKKIKVRKQDSSKMTVRQISVPVGGVQWPLPEPVMFPTQASVAAEKAAAKLLACPPFPFPKSPALRDLIGNTLLDISTIDMHLYLTPGVRLRFIDIDLMDKFVYVDEDDKEVTAVKVGNSTAIVGIQIDGYYNIVNSEHHNEEISVQKKVRLRGSTIISRITPSTAFDI